MDANFDEKKAFEDLKIALKYLHDFANYYYAEMEKAQELCAEKDRELADLKRQYDADRVKTDNSHKEALQAKDDEISCLEEKIFAQAESFKAHLKEYGDYNMQLTQELERLRADLDSKENRLNKLADRLKDEQDQLNKDRTALKTERDNFEADKQSYEEKFFNYASMEKQIENFDAERRSFKKKIDELEQSLDQKDDYWQNELNTVTTERDTLRTKVANLQGQLDEYAHKQTAENYNGYNDYQKRF